jgi:acetoin utilization protein AcuC
VPLPVNTNDEVYLWAFFQVVPPLLDRFQPDVLVTQLGIDTHYADPLGNLALTTRGHEALFSALATLAPPKWLALGGGGYNLSVVPRSWALATAVMAEQSLPEALPPAYRAAYGGETLHEPQVPVWVADTRSDIRAHVEEVVDGVRARHEF